MTLEGIVLIALLAAVVIWFISPRNSRSRSPTTSSLSSDGAGGAHADSADGTFFHEVTATRREIDAQVATSTEGYQKELKHLYSADLEVKERLSQFARENKLDEALVALWEEAKHYPSWAKRADFEKWNKLGITNIDGSNQGEINTLSFCYGEQQYSISKKEWHGIEADTYADFSLHEDGLEIFGVRCSVDYSEYGTSFNTTDISAFKKRGRWARMLLETYGKIKAEQNKISAKFRYYGADEIKGRFEE